jgi:Na+(H+)/acetate symporter ActP
MIAIAAITLVALSSTLLGALSLRVARSTSDFLVASRSVRPSLNASAICGEYLSAGTFLGLAGLVMTFGVDMLWYPVGYTAGYLVLLLLVAAPLRRFGAYTIPEFAFGRLGSVSLRRVCAGFVLVIGWMYLLPQMKGAGITLSILTGAPYWVGVVLVAVIVAFNVAFGGMRGITFVQAFQYFVKVVAISVPAIVLIVVAIGDGSRVFRSPAPVTQSCLRVRMATGAVVNVSDTAFLVSTKLANSNTNETSDGLTDETLCTQMESQTTPLAIGQHVVKRDEVLVVPKGARLPAVGREIRDDGPLWERPFSSRNSARPHPLYAGYSLIVGTFLGTMGLPHILVRFYTNPDGRATRKTIVVVLCLLAIYYIWPPVYGVLGRWWTPELLLTGQTDAVVILLPQRMVGGLGGKLLTGLVAAGAFAAFLSTASGLLISVAGAISHDVLGGGVRRFRQAAIGAACVAALLGLRAQRFEINVLVGWAFAIAASSFCPLLLLGIWWRRFTWAGALAGLVAGGGSAAFAIFTVMLGPKLSGWPAALLAQPAAWTVPIAFAACVVVSKLTPHLIPKATDRRLARMHTPERMANRTQ